MNVSFIVSASMRSFIQRLLTEATFELFISFKSQSTQRSDLRAFHSLRMQGILSVDSIKIVTQTESI
jgi:hypothetical protein